MEQIMNYVKPELIVVAIVLYFCGMALKQTQVVKDKYIPMLLGAGGNGSAKKVMSEVNKLPIHKSTYTQKNQ